MHDALVVAVSNGVDASQDEGVLSLLVIFRHRMVGSRLSAKVKIKEASFSNHGGRRSGCSVLVHKSKHARKKLRHSEGFGLQHVSIDSTNMEGESK